MILRLMAGGAGVGAGAGLLTSLLKHVNTLNVEREPEEDEQALTVRLPNQLQKMASPSYEGLLAAGPALAGSGLLSYHLARKFYEKYRRGEVQHDLTDADEAYRQALALEAQGLGKKANVDLDTFKPHKGMPMTGSDSLAALLMAGAISVPFLSTAVLANTLLSKRYPNDQPTSPVKNIVLRPSRKDEEAQQKFAQALPLAVEVALSQKRASYLPSMIKAAGDGYIEAMEDAVMTSGWDCGRTMDLFKTASESIPTLRMISGTLVLQKSAMLSDGFAAILGAELADLMGPELVKIAGALPEHLQDDLIKWAAMHTQLRFCAALDKQAGVSPYDQEAAGAKMQDYMESQDPDEAMLATLAGSGAQSDDSTGSASFARLQIPPVDFVDGMFSQQHSQQPVPQEMAA